MNTSTEQTYDVVVIGGGIQGAGVALLARAAGYRVMLLEQATWAAETSSKSSKLIHGGLRYLQTGQFKLVYQCLRERRWMLTKLPHLVQPNWFYIPLYRHSPYPVWKVHLGLWLYRWLAGNSPHSQYKKVPRSQWATLAGLQQQGLRAVFQQYCRLGGEALEHTQCLHAHPTPLGHRLFIQRNQQPLTSLSAKIVVNASGPWVNALLQQLDPKQPRLAIEWVQGSHLCLSPQLAPVCFYLPALADQRVIFCLPWQDMTLVGTTEVVHHGLVESAQVTTEEVAYLTQVVRHYFPQYRFRVQAQFCGLRVLPSTTASPFVRNRDTVIVNRNRIISLYGGKLTAWRATAQTVLQSIQGLIPGGHAVDFDCIMDRT